MVACAGRYQLVLAFIRWLWLAMVTMAISNHEATPVHHHVLRHCARDTPRPGDAGYLGRAGPLCHSQPEPAWTSLSQGTWAGLCTLHLPPPSVFPIDFACACNLPATRRPPADTTHLRWEPSLCARGAP